MSEPRGGWDPPDGWGGAPDPGAPAAPPAAPFPPATGPAAPAAPGGPAPGGPPPGAPAPGGPAPGGPAPGGPAPSAGGAGDWQAPPGWGGPPDWQAPPGWGGPADPRGPSDAWGSPAPEVRPGVVPLRPLGLGELLDGAVGVVRRYPRPTLGLSAIVALVQTLLGIVLVLTAFEPLLTFDPASLETGDTAELQTALGALFAGGTATLLLALVSGAVLTGSLTAVVGKAVLGQPIGLGGAWAQVRPLLARLVGLSLAVVALVVAVVVAGIVAGTLVIALGGAALALVGVPLILGSLLLAVWLYTRLSLAPCVLVLERSGIRSALRRSGELVKGDWWRVFGILLLTFVIAQFVSQVVQVPFLLFGDGPLAGLDPDAEPAGTGALVVAAVGAGIATTIVAPFTSAVRALLYVDRRMRAEGLDVALAAAAASPPRA
jgi:hypothetical protein